jgi:hypothetical protein
MFQFLETRRIMTQIKIAGVILFLRVKRPQVFELVLVLCKQTLFVFLYKELFEISSDVAINIELSLSFSKRANLIF